MKDTIIIYSCRDDEYVDLVINYIDQRKFNLFRLNSDDLPQVCALQWDSYNDKYALENMVSNRVAQMDQVRSIWIRKPDLFAFPEDFSIRQRLFYEGETNSILSGLLFGTSALWINHPTKTAVAELKLLQLAEARRLGFRTPQTLVTMCGEEGRNFFERNNRKVVVKTLTDPFMGIFRLNALFHGEIPADLAEPLMFPTTLIDESNMDFLQGTLAPTLLQEYIPKKLEYRVIVVGDKVFSVAIDSQKSQASQVDWRMFDEELHIYPDELPEDIKVKCIQFTRAFGLVYNAIDIILTPEGSYCFLEGNPGGQYGFVEKVLSEHAISMEIARLLMEGITNERRTTECVC